MSGRRRLEGWRCPRGHVYLHRHDGCPSCGARMVPTRLRATATLVACTTVRVTPTGVPQRLGVAVTLDGARTLCVVRGGVRGWGYDRVLLTREDGRFIARGRAARAGSRVRPASVEDY